MAGKTPLGAEQITLLWSKEYLEGHGPAVPLDIWLAKHLISICIQLA